MTPEDAGITFAFFNEVGILEQLSRSVLEEHLPDGLIAPHFTVLNHLVRVGEGRTPLQMARAFQVPKTSLTHTLSGLESRGLIEMRRNPDDGRSKLVYLTDAGRTLRQETIDALVPVFSGLLDPRATDRMRAALPTLTKIRQILDAARDP